jgi:hypothetical protein
VSKKELPFSGFDEASVIKTSLNGFDDPSQFEFSFTTRASFVQDPSEQIHMAYSEYLDSYIEALKSVCDACTARAKSEPAPARAIAETPSPVLPALYLCHHIVELALKQVLFTANLKINPTHRVLPILDSCDRVIRSRAGDRVIKDLKKFVIFVSDFDATATTSRYPIRFSKKIVSINNKSSLVNTSKLFEWTNIFVQTLRDQKLIPLNPFSENQITHLPGNKVFIS